MVKVINFHAVNSPQWFEMVVKYLCSKFNMISAKDLYDYYYEGKKLKKACLITVDDGHISSYEVINIMYQLYFLFLPQLQKER